MFFILSKVLFVFSQPTFWLLLLLFWAYSTKDEGKRRKLIRYTFFIFFFLTNPFAIHRVFEYLENRVICADMKSPKTYEVGIVLGGFSHLKGRDLTSDEPLPFNFASNRLLDAAFYLKQGKIKKILITGGDGRLAINYDDLPEADLAKNFLVRLGIPDSCIIIENKSRNTFENALFSAKVLDSLGLKNSQNLLITSALHMKRAASCFWKQDVRFDCYATSYQAKPVETTAENLFIPDERALELWQFALREQMGILAYWLTGKL